MATPQHILEIIRKRLQQQPLSKEEQLQVKEWFNLRSTEATLFAETDWEKDLSTYLQLDADDRRLDQALQRFRKAAEFKEQPVTVHDPVAGTDQPIDGQTNKVRAIHRVRFLRKWGWAAASVILLIAAGVFLLVSSRRQVPSGRSIARNLEIQPGKDGAILTLADGRQVVLDSLSNGVVATQNGTRVVLKNGQLTYDPAEKNIGTMDYNTMSTPKGRQYHVTLSDGTQVWLNSASSLRYPTVFAGHERRVEVTGEAYFEVARNAKQPFFVKIDDQAEVEVLGTSFNVNAYKNEKSINTTLLEGSVKIWSGSERKTGQHTRPGNSVVLKPGQQAQIVQAGEQAQAGIKVTDDANIEEAMAWKNALFYFQGKDLGEVMRQLERWYDIEVVYEKGIPDIRFGGELRRDVSLEDLLKVLEASKVHFRIEEGRKLVVMP